jgi:Lar family restriction alleviation protein
MSKTLPKTDVCVPALLACPFCGSDAVKLHKDVHGNNLWWVECRECDAEGGTRPTIGAAITVWNRRALVRDLFRVGTGELAHVYAGTCPDAVAGWDSRDEHCPACRVLMEAERSASDCGAKRS